MKESAMKSTANNYRWQEIYINKVKEKMKFGKKVNTYGTHQDNI